MACCPLINLAEALLDDSPPQVVAQLHRPQTKNRVRSAVRSRTGKIARISRDRFDEARGEISREERRISRYADNKGAIGVIRGRPIEPGKHARERASKIRYVVWHYREAERRKAPRVAIGVEHKRVDLRPYSLDDALEQWNPAQQSQGLIATTHAPRLSAGEQQANNLHAASSMLALRER